MYINSEKYFAIIMELQQQKVKLIAVSKTKPIEAIQELYDLGHRDFGENYVQELVEKAEKLPKDINWHFIGHLQTNKAKYIVPYISLIHSVDSLKLLKEINKQANKLNKKMNCLLQVHIAQEETKFGLDENELADIFYKELESLENINVIGLMGMASFTEDKEQIEKEFLKINALKSKYSNNANALNELSIGMSSDYTLAIEQGSTMVRIGSLLFGSRN